MTSTPFTAERKSAVRNGPALAVIAAAQLMVMLDLTIVNVALPSIQRDLHFSLTNLTWVIDAYVLVFGGLLLLGGRTGDIFGRRRMFVLGIALFSVASFAGGLATSQGWLIAARAVQGAGAAIASPTALALVAITFGEGPARNRAMAVYAGMTAAGGATGLILGGLLVETASWRWVFFVNVPIGLVLLIAAPLVLPKVDGHGGRMDIPGALTVSGAMALLVYGLVRAPTAGWSDSITLLSFALALAFLGSFLFIELNSDEPLIPRKFLSNRNRAGGYAVMLLIGGAMLALLFFLTQFLQDVLHYSSLRAGVSYLPIPVMVASTSVILSKKIRKLGIRLPLTLGPLFIGVGLGWASFINQSSSYLHVLGPLATIGLGMGLSLMPLTLNAVSSVRNHEQGLASSLLNTSQQIGGSLGLAVLVTLSATAARHHVQSATSSIVHSTGSMPGAQALRRITLAGTVHGYQVAVRGGAIGAVLAFFIAAVVVRGPQPTLEAVSR